ncbi:MAG TPA: V-type ATP synthase subunit E family protein [Nitrososphaeraceae archaeon]|nr:V-type ATP synthase subunit E family protein [Nitrososphaeraceae archaeon]
MSSISPLERTIDKVLSQREADLIEQIDSAYKESIDKLEASKSALDAEYTKIISLSQKQAENLKRQIIGSSRLVARNKQLILIERAVNDVFEKAKAKLSSLNDEGENYSTLIKKMLKEAVSEIPSEELIVECNTKDRELVKMAIEEISRENNKIRMTLSDESLNVIGGIRIMSSDRSMSYDNTLDSRIERLKPLIRKDIAQMLRGE